jgi:hypothetical protein
MKLRHRRSTGRGVVHWLWRLAVALGSLRRRRPDAGQVRSHEFGWQMRGRLRLSEYLRDRLRPAMLRLRRPDD